MSAFNKVIGYESIKNNLMEIVDMIKNPEVYKRLGARLPRGILLNGDPGLGKTLLATSFIEECGVPSFKLNRNGDTKDFIEDMNRVFEEAKSSTPSIIFLDDMDKFSVNNHSNKEYAALQSLIDSLGDSEVFLIATANDTRVMPSSLIRAGRFDRYIDVFYPTREDSAAITKHYISNRPLSENINMDDVAKMLSSKSCAELDAVINEAAIAAASKRSEVIEMEHLLSASLREAYGIIDECENATSEEIEEIAYHEAGHAVISDVILEGSVGLLSVCGDSRTRRNGFMLRCLDVNRRAYEILISLGGKAGSELKYGKIASGTQSDLSKAVHHVSAATTQVGTAGFMGIDLARSGSFKENVSDVVVSAELERYLFKAKEIICNNREYFEKVARELCEKKTLLNSDIARIRATCTITPAVVG